MRIIFSKAVVLLRGGIDSTDAPASSSCVSVRRRHYSRGFTLVELLVVIAIISILMALLSPGLKHMREMGKRAACMTHMRQIALGLNMMADDHDGWLDSAHCGDFWQNTVVPYVGGMTNLVRVTATNKAVGCPGHKPAVVGNTFFGVNCNFAYNIQRMRSIREVTNPANTFLIADSFITYMALPADFDDAKNGGGLPLKKARHAGDGLNLIFVDGHGEFASRARWYANSPPSPWYNGPSWYSIWGQ